MDHHTGKKAKAPQRPSNEPTEASDYGTHERHQHHTVVPELTGKGMGVRMRVKDGSMVDRLLYSGDIDDIEHSCLMSFSRDVMAAGIGMCSTAKLGGTSGVATSTVSDGRLMAMQKVAGAVRRVTKECGAASARDLVAIAGDEKFEWSIKLKEAIASLSRYQDEWRGSKRKAGLSERIDQAVF